MMSSQWRFAGWGSRVLTGLLCCVGLAVTVATFGAGGASDSNEKAAPPAKQSDDEASEKKKADEPGPSKATTQKAPLAPKLLAAKRRALASVKKTPKPGNDAKAGKPSQATTKPSILRPKQGPDRSTKIRPSIGSSGRRGEQRPLVPDKRFRSDAPARKAGPKRLPVKTPTPPGGKATPASTKLEDKSAEAEATDYSGATKSSVANTRTTVVLSTEPPDPEARTYRFQYDKTPWPDVLSDFSRISGLPVVYVSDPLPGALTYRTSEELSFLEAIHKLNWLLQQQPLNNYVIQRKTGYLSVGRLPDLMRRIPPEKMFKTFEAFESAELDPYDVCLTFFEVPEGWTPFEVIEEFRPMFSDTYGTQMSGETTIALTGLVWVGGCAGPAACQKETVLPHDPPGWPRRLLQRPTRRELVGPVLDW